MKTLRRILSKIDQWANAHFGSLALLSLLVAILVPVIQSLSPNITAISGSDFKPLVQAIAYTIPVPVSVVVFLLIAVIMYIRRSMKKYEASKIDFTFLVGKWALAFTFSDGRTGHETFEITNDRKYLIDGIHRFNIEDFEYTASQNRITFTKTPGAVQNRRPKLFNQLIIDNNDSMTGIEIEGNNKYSMKYTRING